MVLTFFAFLLHRNWSARTGELHAVHGLEFYCWWSVEQNGVAVNAAVCAGGKQAGEGCRAATTVLWTRHCTWECRAGLEFVQVLQNLSALGGSCCCCSWSLLSSSFTDTNQLHSSCLIIFSLCPSNQFTVSIAAFLILSASSANQGLH